MGGWQAILDFWLGELTDGMADDAHRKQWFTPDSGFDGRCRDRFEHLLSQAAEGALAGWLTAPKSALAYIVLCDQLPRNIHRATPAAFAWDELALAAARRGIEDGLDRHLVCDERAFFYMPFEHSEAILDQHTAVGLFTSLRDASPKDHRQTTGNYLRFAQQHRDIILRFGRFPHRNEVLGRSSSDAELEFVATGDGFGQSAGK
jgi:uncharacterized protein (DUF924 family)